MAMAAPAADYLNGPSVAEEAGGVVLGLLRGTLGRDAKDSAADLAAYFHGQMSAFIFWRSCKTLCESCPF